MNKIFQNSIRLQLFSLLIFGQIQTIPLLAQRFNSALTQQPIPDFVEEQSTMIEIPLVVSGLATRIDSSFGIEAVQIAIKHLYISDVKVVLLSPDGTEIWLTNRNGRDGSNYNETRFSQIGYNGLISEGIAPFQGEYVPDGQLFYFNNGQNPNGTWLLRIYDLKAKDVGTFNSASLFFGRKPAKEIASPCSFSRPQNCSCANGARSGKLLPDLVPNALVTKKNIIEHPFDPVSNKGELLFAVETMNVGLGPFEMGGKGQWFCGDELVSGSVECKDGTMSRQTMEQTIYSLQKGKFRKSKKIIGSIAYDRRPGHEHFHFDDYVTYELLEPSAHESDTTKWRVIGRGYKASFCLWNLGWCREDLQNCHDRTGKVYFPSNLHNYGLGGNYRNCDASLQGISVGGTDLYGENYEGQSLELPPGTCNGTYWLRVTIDPKGLIIEADKKNNTLIIPVELKGQKVCR